METLRQLRFVKTDPSGNTTAILLDALPSAAHGKIAKALMEAGSLAVEQAAFVDAAPPREADFAIRMMGGEFCGNAVRSAAAWLVFDRMRWQPVPSYGVEKQFEISCSGIERNVRCAVRALSRNTFDVTAGMPLPLSVDKVFVGGAACWRAELPGITHTCFFMEEDPAPLRKREIIESVLSAYPAPAGGAAGVLFWDGTRLDPFVYVRDTDTLVNESSCGSGTAALAACLAAKEKKTVHIGAAQRGGLIYADAAWDKNLTGLSIGGSVKITAEGMVFGEF